MATLVRLVLLVVGAMTLNAVAAPVAGVMSVVINPDAAPRVVFGAQRLVDTLEQAGIESRLVLANQAVAVDRRIEVHVARDAKQNPEGFSITSTDKDVIVITGQGDSGALYGCLELAGRVRSQGRLPEQINFSDAPVFTLRGPCIGMQKTYILPGRKVYEYPYTPELFPFFYDKSFWQEYLDFLVENRMNTLYLWNGHPFASLVKLKDYPYALEVPEEVFQKNVEMFRYISTEADKRGIWVVQMFYSIILSKPFAEHHGIDTQLKAPTPEASDYMRKSIAEFITQYPNVGLLVCLGEALQGLDNQVFWLNDVVLAGVKDAMKARGISQEPPVVVRAHATDPSVVMPAALKVYSNLYTMAKYNGESLTTWEPRGKRQQVHLLMSRLGSSHVANVHILANLEPFRYGAQRFIRKCVIAARDRLGAKGIHLYPLFYWDWPNSPDKVDPPLKQIERDWIWFEAWARYAWNPDIEETADHAYWVDRLAGMYGTKQAGQKILDAYNDAGECAPRILRRFGITEGNRQTMSLGMTLDQLVNPAKYREFPELWESQSPPGERLNVYVEREWKKLPHEGETPVSIIAEVLDYSKRAVEAIEAAAPHVTKNQQEFQRLRNDIHCIRAMSQNYAAKANAAIHVLRYNYSHDISDMEKAAVYLAESLDHFRELTRLTENSYRFANSMQTSQRRIPVPGGADGKPANYHWTQLLPIYEAELAEFQQHVQNLRQGTSGSAEEANLKPLPTAKVKVLSPDAEAYRVEVGATPFTDRRYKIESIAPELVGLTGIRFSHEQAKNGRYSPVEFEVDEPVQVLIGYFNDARPIWLQVPNLETDALAAERGGIEPLILNAASIEECPSLNVHALKFDRGRQKLEVRGSGSFVVLGVVPQSVQIPRRDAKRPGGR